MTRSGWAIGLLGLALAAQACGGSADSGLKGGGGSSGTGAGGSATGGGAGTGGAGGSVSGGAAGVGGAAGGSSGGASGAGGSAGYTLDDVCAKLAPQGCGIMQSCCTKSGFGYDANGCQAHSVAGCEQNVAAVKAGTMAFDPTSIAACLSNLQKLFAECVPPANEFFDVLAAVQPCQLVFQGQLPEGASCDRDAQCALTNDPKVFVACDKTSKKCTHYSALGINDACALGTGVTSFCDKGLYCDASLLGIPPYKGICKTATVVGQKCNTFKPYDLECGLGFYCNQATGVCTSAKVGGVSCVETVECQSLSCNAGTCGPQEPLVDQASCTG